MSNGSAFRSLRTLTKPCRTLLSPCAGRLGVQQQHGCASWVIAGGCITGCVAGQGSFLVLSDAVPGSGPASFAL